MTKLLSKTLSVVLSVLMILSSTNIVFAESSELSEAPIIKNIIIANNAGASDTVTVIGVLPQDIVTIYSESTDSKIGRVTVASGKTEAIISVPQLGQGEGIIYVTVKSTSLAESERTYVTFDAEAQSPSLDVSAITVINNAVGTQDSVQVIGLEAGDIVKVYSLEIGGRTLGTATVPKAKSEATVSISQIGATSGKVYVTVTRKTLLESTRTEVLYDGEVQSISPDASSITVTNNAVGTADAVIVTGLVEGDIVKVYSSELATRVIGTGTVPSGKTDATVIITQLGISSGNIYVTVTSKTLLESSRTEATYDEESKTIAPLYSNIVITNNTTATADTVKISNVVAGDLIKVYSSIVFGRIMGTTTVAAGKTEGTVSIAQLGAVSGNVYVTVTNIGKSESDRTAVAYIAEGKSAAPLETDLVITNNAAMADTIKVSNIKAGDNVKIYRNNKTNTVLGALKVATGKTEVILNIPQLGVSSGSVYVTVTSAKKLESDRMVAYYSSEIQSKILEANNITVTNNVLGILDTVIVKDLTVGDVIKVYLSELGGRPIGTATVQAEKTVAAASITQLGINSGSVYVTVTSMGKSESDRCAVGFHAEPQSQLLDIIANNIKVSNNITGISDTVKVSNIVETDIINVYKDSDLKTKLGTIKVATGKNEGTVIIPQLGMYSGSVYITVTNAGKRESDMIEVQYDAEPKTLALLATDVTIIRNAINTPDTIKVANQVPGTIVKVYKDNTTIVVLGASTVVAGKPDVTVNIPQLAPNSGSVYVSVTVPNRLESDRMQVTYDAQAQSTPLDVNDITVINYAVGTPDTIQVTDLAVGDIVKVYASETGGTAIGTSKAVITSTATVSIPQLGVQKGSIYVSIIRRALLESDRTVAEYDDESQSPALINTDITVSNYVGIADTVKIENVVVGDIIKVYRDNTLSIKLGTITVAAGKRDATISIYQLGKTSGSLYMTITNAGKSESEAIEVKFDAEEQSIAPDISNIVVNNNLRIADTVEIENVVAGDIINVYKDDTLYIKLGTVVVSAAKTDAIINVFQLGKTSGSVYITVTNAGKSESSATEVTYDAELRSEMPLVADVKITNNAGMEDTIKVENLKLGDIVKVYKDETTTTAVLGTATVSSGKTDVTIKIPQLGLDTGSVYLSVTTKPLVESDRIEIAYDAEEQSTPLSVSNIIVTNNTTGTKDTLKISNVVAGDRIKVYRDSSTTTKLATLTITDGITTGTVNIDQLGISSGKVYVTVTNIGKSESDRTNVPYLAEPRSTAIKNTNVTITNNAGRADTIKIVNLISGSIVKIYRDSETIKVLATAKVAAGSTDVTLRILQLGSSSGSVHVTVTAPDKIESDRTQVAYIKEVKTSTPVSTNVSIVNNAKKVDIVKVIAIASGDIIKVYRDSAGTKKIGTVTVAAGNTYGIVKIAQLGISAGSIYITITKEGQLESDRIQVTYNAEH